MDSLQHKYEKLSTFFEKRLKNLNVASSYLSIKGAIYECLIKIKNKDDLNEFNKVLIRKGGDKSFPLAKILDLLHFIDEDLIQSTFFASILEVYPQRLNEFYDEIYLIQNHNLKSCVVDFCTEIEERLKDINPGTYKDAVISNLVYQLIRKVFTAYDFEQRNNFELDYILKKIASQFSNHIQQDQNQQKDSQYAKMNLINYFNDVVNHKMVYVGIDTDKTKFILNAFTFIKNDPSKQVVFTPSDYEMWQEVDEDMIKNLQEMARLYMKKKNLQSAINLLSIAITITCVSAMTAYATNFNGFKDGVNNHLNPQKPKKMIIFNA